ncbi:MAG: formate dehydrogenase accessory protein FdhE [Alcaligenaceae bacterium]|nr:formate dehydrogenase accessory protein FdhE [Alcaligenaceae bacterium]
MQRVLARGEIESLDHTSIPRLRLPVRAAVFSDRAARLRQLAQDSPLAGYLSLMADLADGQHQALRHCKMPGPTEERIDLAQAHGMPPLQATGWRRDPAWRALLAGLLDHMAALHGLPPQAAQAVQGLRHALDGDPDAIEAQADAILAEREDEVDAAAAPFIMAALQVYWAGLAADFPENALPVVTPHGVCPLCGSLPVASVVRVGGSADGCRYLCCSLCAAEWHLVRVTCSHCKNTQDVSYHSIEDGPEGVKAESCDACHTYRKIFYQEKILGVDAVADDLASLTLDMLMGEAGYARASGNPLLWQQEQAAS